MINDLSRTHVYTVYMYILYTCTCMYCECVPITSTIYRVFKRTEAISTTDLVGR